MCTLRFRLILRTAIRLKSVANRSNELLLPILLEIHKYWACLEEIQILPCRHTVATAMDAKLYLRPSARYYIVHVSKWVFVINVYRHFQSLNMTWNSFRQCRRESHKHCNNNRACCFISSKMLRVSVCFSVPHFVYATMTHISTKHNDDKYRKAALGRQFSSLINLIYTQFFLKSFPKN